MSVTVTDNFIPYTWAQSYPETWGSSTNDWKYGIHDYGLLATVTLALAEALAKSASKKAGESVSVTDRLSKEAVWERSFAEAVSVMETYWDVIKFQVSVSESFSITDDETNKIVKGVMVTLQVAEKVPKSVTKFLPITIFVEDGFFHKTKTLRKFAESIDFAEVAGKHTRKNIEDVFSIVDFFYKMFTNNVPETITLTELLTRSVSAQRIFEEDVNFDEVAGKHPEINKADLFSIRDTILQASNAILNNIFVRHGEITKLEDFESLVNQAPGFTEFIDFKVGEYDYEEALVKLAVRSKMEQGKPTINNLTMHVDIPDTDDRGSETISGTTAATRVSFNKHYYNPPEVNVLVIGGYDSDNGALTPYITSITTTYFDVEIRNAGGSRVTGIISWFAKGY